MLNERVVRDDILTSVHVDEYALEVRETKRGMEELTNDIPNVSEDATKDLDERGIIRIGAHVVPGDIMIGKITPKGESDPTPEEKLLRAIFGDKAGDVKDASLKASPSLKGVVIGTNLFSRAAKKKKSKTANALLPKLDEEYEAKLDALLNVLVDKLLVLTDGLTSNGVHDFLGSEIVPKGAKFSASVLRGINYDTLSLSNWTSNEHKNELIRQTIINYLQKYKEIDAELRRKKFDISIGDELPSGIMQIAKVYIAKKRKISVGDKMAGRHGNKGIVSRIVRQEDMPFLADGTPVDIVLNPLGCAFAYEPGPGIRDRARLGRPRTRREIRHTDFRRCHHGRHQLVDRQGRPSALRQDLPLRRRHGRTLRPACNRGRNLHAQARPHGRRQDACPLYRPVLAHYPAAPRR